MFALGRVYRNLVVNAIQATAPGGLVVAAVEGQGDRVQISVYDTGCGIPAIGSARSSRISSRPSGAGSGSASRSRARSSSSSAARSAWPARSARARRSSSTSPHGAAADGAGGGIVRGDHVPEALHTAEIEVEGRGYVTHTSSRKRRAARGASAARSCSTPAIASSSTTIR